MKKLTKKSLRELAVIMPQLSEVEQRDFVGGDVIVVDKDGHYLGGDASQFKEKIAGIGYDYEKVANDPTHTLWVIEKYSGRFDSCYLGDGSIKNNKDSGSKDEFDFEGTGINRDALRFLGEHTNVEWMMYEDMSGEYGRLQTSHLSDGFNGMISSNMNGHTYTTAIHTHPDMEGKDPKPSKLDTSMTGAFIDAGFDKCMIYSAKTNSWVVYMGEKDKSKNEKYVKDVRWD